MEKSWFKNRANKRIIVDPNNPDVACVCALENNGGQIKERGVFKTTDGGNTWDEVYL